MFQVIYAHEWINDTHDQEMQVQLGKTNTRGVTHRLTSFHPFQRLSDLRFLDSPHKAPIGVIKRVIQLKCCVCILTIEQFVKILLPSMSDLILLHQEMLPFILNVLNLVEVPYLSLKNPNHPINVILSLLRT